jgi:hypothetical protein
MRKLSIKLLSVIMGGATVLGSVTYASTSCSKTQQY